MNMKLKEKMQRQKEKDNIFKYNINQVNPLTI